MAWTTRSAKRATQSRGAVAVETALVTVFFLIPLIVGGLEVGRVMWVKNQLTNAAREGGWVAQNSPWKFYCGDKDPESIQSRALAGLRQGSNLLAVQTDSITVTAISLKDNKDIKGCTNGAFSTGDRILITVKGPLSSYSRLGLIPASFEVSGSQEVRVL